MAGRRLLAAASAEADQEAAKAASAPTVVDVATVTSVSPLTVSWRGASVPARRGAAYTPGVGDRVLIVLVADQPVIFDRII